MWCSGIWVSLAEGVVRVRYNGAASEHCVYPSKLQAAASGLPACNGVIGCLSYGSHEACTGISSRSCLDVKIQAQRKRETGENSSGEQTKCFSRRSISVFFFFSLADEAVSQTKRFRRRGDERSRGNFVCLNLYTNCRMYNSCVFFT